MDAAFVVLLGALTTLPPLSIDISLPGLPVIARALDASDAAMAQSLSAFVVAFGAGQLVLGPVSDRYGRRPVLLAGLFVFALAGLACTFATSGPMLVAARCLQGLGACAGTMSARAIVQDVAPSRERAASLQAYVSAVTSVAPIVAPLLGAGILATLGWRWMYGVLVVAGIVLLGATFARLPETAPGTTERGLASYARVLRLPRTIPLAVLVACSFGAYFALISGSPFALVTQLHLSSGSYAIAFAINALALLGGSFATARLAPRLGAEHVFGLGVGIALAAAAATCAFDVLLPGATAFVATFALFAFASGIVMPSAFAAGLADARGDAGVASGLLGSAQMIGGAAGSAVAGALPLVASAGVGVTVLGATLVAALAYAVSRRR